MNLFEIKKCLHSYYFLLFISFLSACSRTQETSEPITLQHPVVPSNTFGPPISAGSREEGRGRIVTLSNGAEIFLQRHNGVEYALMEGTFSGKSFSNLISSISLKPAAERHAIVKKEVEKVFSELKKVQGFGLKVYPEVGYFTFEIPYEPDVMASLKRLSFSHTLYLNPVHQDQYSIKALKDYSPFSEGLSQRSSPRGSSHGYCGLDRMKVVQFVEQAETDIGGGVHVDGSLVRVGVTDTGVTLNHDSFRSNISGLPRITYLKDFTREGRVYFSKSAAFEVSVPTDGSSEDLLVNAEIIVTPPLPSLPEGDVLTKVKDLKIKASSRLRDILTKPGNGARLGVLSEAAFQSAGEPVDLNGNGTVNDQLFMILVPGDTPENDVVYLDVSGTGDFRNSLPLGDWNRTKTTAPAFSEKFGFHFADDILPANKGKEPIQVRSVSLVGFDPGNHGTHVSGIIAATKMIGNDDASTLARGVAPEASLLVNRVCANNGGCRAAEAMIDLVVNGHADVVNMSLGGLNPFNDGYGVQETLLNRLSSVYNVLFVVSAGNSGPGRQTVGSPSTARSSLSVGATATREMIQRQYQWPGAGAEAGSSEDGDFMLFFSSRGPTAAGGFKPNISAPGTELSSIQLNSAPGQHGGLDVYWGTSMAAPAATGAYALYLDAIRKYNIKNPQRPLPTDSSLLREILIHTARPFDVTRFDLSTGEKLKGQYTWIDQGTGMVDLVAAWKKLFEYREKLLPTSVQLAGNRVDLDYQVMIPQKTPRGVSYDGSRVGPLWGPEYGTGLYLDYFGNDTSLQVTINRKLPDILTLSENAGSLMAQLKTTQDIFVLKTIVYGSDRPWIKAGTLDQLECWDSDTANLSLLGEGGVSGLKPDGTGKLNPFYAAQLNVCINRKMISTELKPGDHGALILAYRTVGGQVEAIPSFTVPVYLTVPHQTLAGSTAYQLEQSVSSFGVVRNYVSIPKEATLVRVTLEVPGLKVGPNSQMLPGQSCSGVELMALLGQNTTTPFKGRQEARISNCDAQGRVQIDDSKRKLTFVTNKPTPGIWDLSVFGSYKYARSKFKLRVDYVVASTHPNEILGGPEVLNGSLKLAFHEASFQITPDVSKSSYSLTGLEVDSLASVKNGEVIFVSSPSSVVGPSGTPTPFRRYADGITGVRISTSGSPGNDIDLVVHECPDTVASPTDPACAVIGKSEGPSDAEFVSFTPKSGKVYAVAVLGATVKDEGKFVSTETLTMESTVGDLNFSGGEDGVFTVQHSFKPEVLLGSRLFNHELFRSSKYHLVGALVLKSAEGTLLSQLPVTVAANIKN